MTLRRVGLSNSLSSQAKISNKRFTLSRVSLRRFPFPTAAAAAAVVNYVEDVFSTYLYTGNGSTQTITNGIDLSGKGGLVWTKARSSSVRSPILFDTVRGAGKRIYSDSTSAETSEPAAVSAFNVNGYNLGADSDVNLNGTTFVSWTFRKQAKFFDVVTYTGNGVSGRKISHNLGSVPGAVIIKIIGGGATGSWLVWHRTFSNSYDYLRLNSSAQLNDLGTINWMTAAPTSTDITLGSAYGNSDTFQFVAYFFAHDAGGFGATGSDNVISCGSFTTDGSGNATVSLGYEPQWVMTKRTDSTGNWTIVDVMRGMTVNAGSTGNAGLYADSSAAEIAGIGLSALPNATGMTYSNVGPSRTFIYIAIRRGPMKTPTSGANVFTPLVRTGTNGSTSVTSLSFSPDLVIGKARQNSYSPAPIYGDKLRGTGVYLGSSATNVETTASNAITGWLNTGYNLGDDSNIGNYNFSTAASNYILWNFARAPGFFDVVCYTGTGVARTINHNLTVVPELMIVKSRSIVENWGVYVGTLGPTKRMRLNAADGAVTVPGATYQWNGTSPTSTVFSVGIDGEVNQSSVTYVAYLFATVAGVSKVGSYTGNGGSQTINCGFTAGARFVLIKRTDSTGDWYVWDTARGIVAGNDPHLSLNSTAVEVTTNDSIDTDNTGFIVNQLAATNINVNGSTYIFLAIA